MLIHAWGRGGGGRRASRKFLLKHVMLTLSVYTPLYGSVNKVFLKCNGGYFLGANFNENRKLHAKITETFKA